MLCNDLYQSVMSCKSELNENIFLSVNSALYHTVEKQEHNSQMHQTT